MTHKHSVYDTDTHFIVNPVSRAITTESTKIRLMQGDHNSERFTFKVPRYIEGHDMSLCDEINIDFVNSSNNKQYQSYGPYPVEDMHVSPDDEDFITFSWLISNNATMYAGNLSFSISFECHTDSNIDYAWHTDSYNDIEINETLKNDGAYVISTYHDVLIHLQKNMVPGMLDASEGQFATSDGKGGIIWKNIPNAEEVTF